MYKFWSISAQKVVDNVFTSNSLLNRENIMTLSIIQEDRDRTQLL